MQVGANRAGDDPFFVGRHHQHLGGTAIADAHLPGRIASRIEFDAQPMHIGANPFAQGRRVFANAAAEYESIEAAEHRRHRAQLTPHTEHVVIERLRGFRRLTGFQRAHGVRPDRPFMPLSL